MEDAARVKRTLFQYFLGVARRCGAEILDRKQNVSLMDRILYALGNALVYGPLRNVLGMSRVRVAYTAGAAIGPDLFRFYRSIGLNLKQLYGSTETCAYVCLQPDRQIKLDTVGLPAPGVEIKIAESGEVLVRSDAMLKEYYRRPDATAEVFDENGYFRTGDAGFFDPDGHLKIIDRAKDVGRLATGAMFAPNYIENKLKFFPYIKEAVAFGDGRDAVCAFINIDLGAVGNWAERRGLPYSGYTDLAAKAEIYDLIQDCVEKANVDLAADPMMADSQVRRFLVLHKELDPDDDELTRTRKVRRGFIAEKYAVLIDALYAGKSSQFIETAVKFEDGRSGIISADVGIRDTAPHAARAERATA
jgi:long-chain acyl-CoA synthetase